MFIVDRGSMFCNRSGGACFFFDIDVKGGEKSPGGESECMWVLVLPSMPKGEIVGKYLIESEFFSLMASISMKINTAEKIQISIQRIVGKNSDGKYQHDQQQQ